MFPALEKLRAVMQQSDITDQAVRGAPAVGGAVASAWTLNTWLMIFTGIYIVLQIAYLGRKWWREEKDWKRKRR